MTRGHGSEWRWTWDHDASGRVNVPVVQRGGWWMDPDQQQVTACAGAYYWFAGARRDQTSTAVAFTGNMLNSEGAVVGSWDGAHVSGSG